MTVSEFKDHLQRSSHGTSTDDLTNIDRLIESAARAVLLDCDPPGTKRISDISNALFDDVYRYAIPSDLKGNKIIDIRPQASRALSDTAYQTYQKDFDLRKAVEDGTLSMEEDDGTRYLLIDKPVNGGLLLNEMESATANGTWTVTGGGTLSADTVYAVTGGAALKISTLATGNALSNTTMTAVDLTDHVENASIFVWVYLPTSTDVTRLTNVILRWGSDLTANYYEDTQTSNFDSTAFRVGWNLIQFDWLSTGLTGSPTATAYDSIRLTFTTTGALTNVRVDSIYSRLPSIYEIVYYSKALFRTSASAWSVNITNNNDTINLDDDGIPVLEAKCFELAAQQRGGKDATPDINYWGREYQMRKKTFNQQYPSESLRPKSYYYRM